MHIFLKILILFLLWGISPVAGTAQLSGWVNPIFIDITQYTDEGVINDILEDRRGFLWIATDKGLLRWDGARMKTYATGKSGNTGPSSNQCRLLAEDKEGNIWIGTLENGLNKFDWRSDTFTVYSPLDTGAYKFQDERVNMLFVDPSGQLWAGPHRKGLSQLVNGRFKNRTFSADKNQGQEISSRQLNNVQKMVSDPADTSIRWMATISGLIRFDTRSGDYRTYTDISGKGIDENDRVLGMRTLVFMPDGHLYIGTWGGGLLRFDTQAETFTLFQAELDAEQDAYRNNFRVLLPLNNDEILVGNPHREMVIFNIRTNAFKDISELDTSGNPFKDVFFALFEATVGPSGMTYLASRTKIYGFHPYRNQFETFSLSNDYPKPPLLTKSTITPDGSVVGLGPRLREIGTYNPASNDLYISRGVSEIIKNENAFYNFYDSFFVNDSSGYLLTESALHPFSKSEGKWEISASTKSFNLPNIGPYRAVSIIELSDGDHLVGTITHGLILFDRGLNFKERIRANPLDSNSLLYDNYLVQLLADDKDRIWIATEEGVSVWDMNSDTWYNRWYRNHPSDTLIIKTVGELAKSTDEGIYVLDYYHGLAKLTLDSDGKFQKEDIISVRQVQCETFYSMAIAPNGVIWLVTNKGIIAYDGDHIRWYHDAHGLPDRITHGDISFLTDGKMVFVNQNMFYTAYPDELIEMSPPLWIGIEQIEVFTTDDEYRLNISDSDQISLTYEERFFSVSSAYTQPWNSQSLKVSYRLSGFQERWSDFPKDLTPIAFTNVSPGEYDLELRITDLAGNETFDTVSFPIRVIPPFWLTWWFYSIAAFLIAATVWFIYSQNIRRIKREQAMISDFNQQMATLKMRSLQIQMNPHFLFNSLNSIKAFVVTREGREAEYYINKFSKLLRHILLYAETDFVPIQEEIAAIDLYLQLESLRFKGKFDFEIHTENIPENTLICLPPMLLQPLAENAVRHGIAPLESHGKIEISIQKIENHLHLTVKDNGVGRKASRERESVAGKRPSLGTRITEERLRLLTKTNGIQANMIITDLTDDHNQASGTSVQIKMMIYESCNN